MENPVLTASVKETVLMRLRLTLLMVVLVGTTSCNRDPGDPATSPTDNPPTQLVPNYTYITSHPGGGGIYVVAMVPSDDFTGTVLLSLKADKQLNAALTTTTLIPERTVAEITLAPDTLIAPSLHSLELQVTQGVDTTVLTFKADILQWQCCPPSEWALSRRDALLGSLTALYPEIGFVPDSAWVAYNTYPTILVVEHWTFLYEDWELRICFHLMIPPYDWSMLWLRPRNETEPVVTIRRESDGTAFPIPIADYPTFYGY